MSSIEIRLFGPLSIDCDGQHLTSFQGRKCRDLLSYLLLMRETSHSREHLAELFWGHLDDTRARHCFNTALWRLQTVLGGKDTLAQRWLCVDAQTVSFTPAACVYLDVVDFEAQCALADQLGPEEADQQAHLRQQAVALYRGDLLTTCYEDWCLAERARLQRLYVRALRRLVHYYGKRRDFDVAIDYAQRILVCDPVREDVHRDLIRLHLEAGHMAAALQQYRSCAAILKRELGVTPMPETRQLLQRIMGAYAEGSDTTDSGEGKVPAATRVVPADAAPQEPAIPVVDVMLRVSNQLRDVATLLESFVRHLDPLQAVVPGAPPHRHEANREQLAAEVVTRLEPVVSTLQRAATGR